MNGQGWRQNFASGTCVSVGEGAEQRAVKQKKKTRLCAMGLQRSLGEGGEGGRFARVMVAASRLMCCEVSPRRAVRQ